MNPAHNQAVVYVLNRNSVPEDRFGWAEAFETWQQRRGAHVDWTYAPTASNEWCATVTCKFSRQLCVTSKLSLLRSVGMNVVNGTGTTRKEARKNAVINIERANILVSENDNIQITQG
jgi:hypothetical protein